MSLPSDPTRRLTPVVRLAPAKLNLTLAVVGSRPDGFHELHSVFVPLALVDRLSLAASGTTQDTLHVHGLDAGRIEENVVLRAIAATRAAVGGSWPGGPAGAPALSVRLEKRIPVAAGLAGGSSDAAATIDGALEAWATTLDPDTLRAVAAGIGSDVPFFAVGGPALIEGRGEHVTPLPGLRGQPGVLLVTPAVGIATRDVFAVFDGLGSRGDPSVRLSSTHLAKELTTGLAAGDLVARAGALAMANDLLPAAAAVMPTLVPFRRALSRHLGRPIGLSGSGPTLWALYASGAEAESAADTVRAAVADGSLASPGGSAPSIIATTIVTHHIEGESST